MNRAGPANLVLITLAMAMLVLSISLVMQINEKTDDRFRASDFRREMAGRDAQLKQLQEQVERCSQCREKNP